MKRIIPLIILLITVFFLPVKAANYTMKELIPNNIETTIRGESLLYKNIKYDNGVIYISNIKNLSNSERNITITVALFNEKKENIGTIFLCDSETLLPETEKKDYKIEITTNIISEENTPQDIKYISVLSENTLCEKYSSSIYVGQTIEEIGKLDNSIFTKDAKVLLKVIQAIVIILIGIFIYKFLFTNKYSNMNSDDTRRDFKKLNKKLAQEREEQELEQGTPPEVKTTKSQEIIEKEQSEASKKGDSDLHNFYQ